MSQQDLTFFESPELKLFELDPLLDTNFSNSLEIYDLAGKFVYDKSAKYMEVASAEEMEFSRVTTYKDVELKVSVTAANIERINKDGSTQRVFVLPGVREDIIEDVLIKLATERRTEAYMASNGKHDNHRFVGITFTIYELSQELKRIGRTYSYPEIKEALTIMNCANLSITSEDDSLSISAPFFPIKAAADRDNAKDTKYFVAFHPMVTNAIFSLNYRRYNYQKAMGFKRNYTRLTYKRLCHRWPRASKTEPYVILLSTLIRAMKTPYPELFKDKALFKQIMEDLVADDVLSSYEMEPKKKAGKTYDWLFTLYATEAFAKQVAANHKVATSIKDKMKAIQAAN